MYLSSDHIPEQGFQFQGCAHLHGFDFCQKGREGRLLLLSQATVQLTHVIISTEQLSVEKAGCQRILRWFIKENSGGETLCLDVMKS